MRFIGVYDYTVILTYLSLFSAFLGMNFSAREAFAPAVICLCICGICDAFDGTVARSKKNRTDDEKAFGIQLDSLCDVVSFGVFPAYLCLRAGADGILQILCLLFYCMCAVSRLAFFNVQEGKRQQTQGGSNKIYRGLPVTTASMILPLVWLTRGLLGAEVFAAVLCCVHGVMGFLFILDFKVKKPDLDGLLKARK